MKITELIKIGLTLNQSNIYLCLLKEPSLSVSEISVKTKIHRRNVYDALDNLVGKGLVNESYVNNNKRFNSTHPEHLLDNINEQKQNISKILPSLIQEFHHQNIEKSVKVFKGIKGIKASFTESLRLMEEGGKYLAIGCVDMNHLLGAFIEEHRKERNKKKVKSKLIFNHEFKKRARMLSKKNNTEVKVLAEEQYLPVQTVMYGKKVTCQILIHDEPFVIQVIDEKFTQNYIKYFEMLWKFSNIR